MTRQSFRKRGDSGVALLMALALLAVFSVLGWAYTVYMVASVAQTNTELRALYARNAAEAGVHAAIGQIEAAMAAGTAPSGLYQNEFPTYVIDKSAQGELDFSANDERAAYAKVTVTDECARVNINHVPREVLESLGLSRPLIRDIKGTLPRENTDQAMSTDTNRHWLSSVDELVTRKIVTPDGLELIRPELLTVYTAYDSNAPANLINLNSAPPEVMAAVLNADRATADRVVAARPFSNLEELCAVAGKDATTFNIPAPLESPGVLPKELSFSSRCFRIRSEGTYANRYQVGDTSEYREERVVTKAAEAVVVFDDRGRNPKIRYWRALGGETQETPKEETEPARSPKDVS